MRTIKSKYPSIHITGGASNISFNLPARKYVNQGFIILSMAAGMDSAILDPLNRDMMGLIYATEALLGQDDFCMEYIGAFRAGIFGNDPAKPKV
jgi:5-methyltetrahydrofolate--homocysteine methyltransferase